MLPRPADQSQNRGQHFPLAQHQGLQRLIRLQRPSQLLPAWATSERGVRSNCFQLDRARVELLAETPKLLPEPLEVWRGATPPEPHDPMGRRPKAPPKKNHWGWLAPEGADHKHFCVLRKKKTCIATSRPHICVRVCTRGKLIMRTGASVAAGGNLC